MNPIIALKDKYVTYRLNAKDKALLRKTHIRLGPGAGEGQLDDDLNHQICIMQAVSMVTHQHELTSEDLLQGGQEYQDHPICVSPVITSTMIHVNDSDYLSDDHRQSLKRLIPDILNTAPVVHEEEGYERQAMHSEDFEWTEAEEKRVDILNPFLDNPLTSDRLPAFRKAIRKAASLYRTTDLD